MLQYEYCILEQFNAKTIDIELANRSWLGKTSSKWPPQYDLFCAEWDVKPKKDRDRCDQGGLL